MMNIKSFYSMRNEIEQESDSDMSQARLPFSFVNNISQHVCLFTMCVLGAQDQKRPLDALDLELQDSCEGPYGCFELNLRILSSGRAANALNH